MKNLVIETLILLAGDALFTCETLGGAAARGLVLRDSYYGWPVSVAYVAESKERKGWFDDAKLDYYPLTVARLARIERYAAILSNKLRS